jgi:CHAT domain-containing protein
MEAKLQAALGDPKIDEAQRAIWASAYRTAISTYITLLSDAASARNDYDTLVKLAERDVTNARAGQDKDKIADALNGLAKAQLAAGQLAAARSTALAAFALRSTPPRRAWLYQSVELLASIAEEADDQTEAAARYRQVLELTRTDALPPPYDLTAEPDASLRAIRARINNFERATRFSSALEARRKLADMEADNGNYSAADEAYSGIARDVPQLYALGAPDERELLRWLAARTDDTRVRTTDIAVHRQQTGVTPDEGETKRSRNAELIANSLQAVLALRRARLLQDEGDLSAAAEAYRAAITQTVNVLGPAFPLTGAYVALAQIERARGNYAAAEGPLTTALADAQRQHKAGSIAGLLAQMGALRREQGHLSEARQLSEDALKLARRTGQRSQIAGVLAALARVESEEPDETALKSAETHLREALAIGRELNLRTSVPYTLSDLGLALEREGRAREALAAYEEAVGLVEALSTSLAPDVSAEVFNTKRGNRDLYERLIKLLIKQGQTTTALGYLERAKSKSLVEALAGAQVGADEPALKQLLARLHTANAATRAAEAVIAFETARSANQRDAARLKTAQDALARAQADYKTALAALQRAHPAYASLVAVRATDIEAIRRSLPPRTLLVEYFPTADTLYIFTLTHDQAPAVRAVPLTRAALADMIKQYRDAVVVPSKSAAFARSTRSLFSAEDAQSEVKQTVASMQTITGQLYELLFAPVQAEIDRADTLLLVPAAELYYLPLHALGRAQADGTINYLIEQKRFAYLAAADTINTAATGQQTANRQELLALGNPDGSLPAATEEVKTISHIFPQSNVYMGGDATLARVTGKPAQPIPYIHFATHGVINSREPKESYLLLAGKPGRLSVRDLVEDTYALSFHGTRLVTLSACQTSIGGWDPSAVYSSLSRAFAKAGAPTVVASLWSVNDASTRDTMSVFYRELAAGTSKAEAMRRAQLAVLHDPRFAHPFFWAPFIVLGDWR